MPKNKVTVVKVTRTEFELSDGRVYQHPVELAPEEIPTPEEFQVYYDHWLSLLDINNDREVANDC